ncbi:hypothetical protein Gotur_034664, partial [Gossypium turneri]
MRMKLNGTIQDFISKALDAYTKEKDNQDSLSYFQENQETESWSNFTILSDFKNQENQGNLGPRNRILQLRCIGSQLRASTNQFGRERITSP